MATSLFKHRIVFLSTPVVSLSFLHIRILVRKQDTGAFLLLGMRGVLKVEQSRQC